MVKATFGYAEETPSLRNFLIRLLVTDYAHHLKGDLPTVAPEPAPAPHRLAERRRLPGPVAGQQQPGQQLRPAVGGSGGDSQARRSSADSLEIDAPAGRDDLPGGREGASPAACGTGPDTADTINADDIRPIATRRQAGHWASLTVAGCPTVPRKALHAVYDALVAAADFFALRNQHQRGFDFPTPPAMYQAYETELYRFDQLYRHFCESADMAEAQGWDMLKPLRADIEACLRQLVS